MNTATIAEDHPVLLPPPNPAKPLHPVYAASIDEAALIAIKLGLTDPGSIRRLPASEREHIADAITEFAAQGVGPKQAARMLDRLKGGTHLTAIDGGGKTTKRRAKLTLVPAFQPAALTPALRYGA